MTRACASSILAALVACLAGCERSGTIGTSFQSVDDGGGDESASDGDVAPDGASDDGQPLQLFVAHAGDDAADGRTIDAPLATLEGAQNRLRSYLPAIDRDVEIRLSYDDGAPYEGHEVVWTHTSPDHTVSFMPTDYQVGMGLDDIQGRPLFDGKSICDSKAPATDSSGGEFCKFLVVETETSAASRVRFYYLSIRNYTTTGIGLHQSGEGQNVIEGCRFERIGNLYFPDQRAGYTAIGIGDSDHNQIRNNRFVDIRDKPGDEKYMHAVYMNVTSSYNTISDNSALRVSGDPIKVRHYSNHNLIEHNTLEYAGVAGFLDWPEGGRHECFSWENVIKHNTLRCGYDGSQSATIKLRPPPEPDDGNPLCVPLAARVRASGNSNSCP